MQGSYYYANCLLLYKGSPNSLFSDFVVFCVFFNGRTGANLAIEICVERVRWAIEIADFWMLSFGLSGFGIVQNIRSIRLLSISFWLSTISYFYLIRKPLPDYYMAGHLSTLVFKGSTTIEGAYYYARLLLLCKLSIIIQRFSKQFVFGFCCFLCIF